ncbi:MAG: DEAD/DEAH box helicase [Victivallales bacterium]|nr:DEAD/DEAH box helicase [Victivallales bacterium]
MKSGLFAKLRRLWTDKSAESVPAPASPAKKSPSADTDAKRASGPPKRKKPVDSGSEPRGSGGEAKRDDRSKPSSPKKPSGNRRDGEQGNRGGGSDSRRGGGSDSRRGGGERRQGSGRPDSRRQGGDREPRRSRSEVAAQQESLANAVPRQLEFPPFEDWEAPAAPAREEGDVFFQDMAIHPRILKALLVDMGFTKCTPIQGMALPDTLAGKDVAGRAQTGTGKTAAFLIAIFNRLLAENPERAPHQPFALCIAPTRELAIQIEHDAAEIGKYCGLSTLAVYGGMNYDRQRDRIAAGVDLVAATPGRLLDYVQQRAIDLSKVKVMVIDEADRMLDMGFIPDVRRIIARLCAPANRQTLLFSATLDRGIMDLAQAWMRPNPVIMETDPEHMVAESIEEIVYAVSSREKLAVLLHLIKNETWSRILIFRNQRRDVERLYHNLHRYGVHCEMLSGDVPQKKRLRVLEAFRKGDIPVVVATDVAGRGIHVDDISHVVNYDFPFEAEDYVHRIGRTGRAGNAGKAVSFAGSDCAFVIPEIEEYIGRPLPTRVPEAEMVEMPPAPKGDHGELPHPRRNSRPSGRPNRSGGGGGRSRSGGGRSRPGGRGRR